MKFRKKLTPQVRSRLRSVLMVAAMLLLNTLSAFAQAGGGFNSTDLKTGISNSLAVIMMFGFVLGISAVIYGGVFLPPPAGGDGRKNSKSRPAHSAGAAAWLS